MYHTQELKNGLRIVTCPLLETDSVSIGVWVKVGGRFEAKRIAGVSHFIEHMLFKGTTQRTTRQIKEEIEGVGGMLNAFTSEECTCYMAKVLKKDFENSLDVLADMVNHAKLTADDVEKERTVILEEIKMYYDLPMHFVHELLMDLLWPGQSLGNFIAGTLESVSDLKANFIRSFKQKYYHPKNILVTVFGNVDPEKVIRQVEMLFSKSSSKPTSRFKLVKGAQKALRAHFEDKKTEQTNFVLGVRCGGRLNPERFKVAVLNVLLGGNMSSRLFEQVREQRGLAYSIRSNVSIYQDTGAFTISAGVDNSKCLSSLRVILRELNKVAEKRVPESELRRAKDYFTGQLLLGLEDGLDHMLWMGERFLFTNEVPSRDFIQQQIESVTANDIRTVARRLFRDQHFNFALIGPAKDRVIKAIKAELKQ